MAMEDEGDTGQLGLMLPAGPINRQQTFESFAEFREWCAEQISFIKGLSLPSEYDPREFLLKPYERLMSLAGTEDSELLAQKGPLEEALKEASSAGLLVKGSDVADYLDKFGSPWTRAGYLARLAAISPSELDAAARKGKSSGGNPLELAVKGYSLAGAMPGVYALALSQREVGEFLGDVSDFRDKLREARLGLDELAADFEKTRDDFEAKLKLIKNSYQDDEALKTAKSYWQDKYDRHNINAGTDLGKFRDLTFCGGKIIIGTVMGFVLVYILFPTFFANLAGDVGQLPIGWSVSTAIFVFLPVFLYIWNLRALYASSKLSTRFAEDAAMRGVMLEVYLTLMKGHSEAVKPEDRTLLLTALFRPLEGFQREEGAPATVLDLVHSVVDGRKGN